MHRIEVKAQGVIECRNNSGGVMACPSGTLAGYENANTQVGIGKASLLVEEQQLWSSQ